MFPLGPHTHLHVPDREFFLSCGGWQGRGDPFLPVPGRLLSTFPFETETTVRSKGGWNRPHQTVQERFGRVQSDAMLRSALLSRALRPLSRGYKATTGLVGLDADPQAHAKLVEELRGLLNDAKDKLPEGVAYRNDVEAMAMARLEVLERETDPEEAEAKLGEVQLEELLEETVEERQLLAQMAEWKPWEVPEGHQVEIIEEGEWLRSQPKEEGQH